MHPRTTQQRRLCQCRSPRILQNPYFLQNRSCSRSFPTVVVHSGSNLEKRGYCVWNAPVWALWRGKCALQNLHVRSIVDLILVISFLSMMPKNNGLLWSDMLAYFSPSKIMEKHVTQPGDLVRPDFVPDGTRRGSDSLSSRDIWKYHIR